MTFIDRFWFAMARRGFILCYHGLTSAEHPSESVVNVPATEFEQLLKQKLAARLGQRQLHRELVRED